MSIQLAFRGGQLRLLEQVGSGATSQVWRGQLEPAGGSTAQRTVAVKIARTAADRTLLALEAERLLWANSYATAQLVDLGRIRHSSDDREVAPDTACLVLSWIGAQSLSQLKIESNADAASQALH